MSKDFEQQLREALQPVEPEEGFEQRRRTKVTRWVSVALAASVAFAAIVGTNQWQARREQEGLEARRQLLEALQLTGEKLDLAYQAVNREEPPTDDDESGA
jgi:negative regulator of sigma E activity